MDLSNITPPEQFQISILERGKKQTNKNKQAKTQTVIL